MDERSVMRVLRQIRGLLEKHGVKPWTRDMAKLDDRIRHANCHEARLEAIGALNDLDGGMG